MTVLDFHPDDLIDRQARGLLNADETRRLGEHLGQCSVCRLEQQLRADFELELGPRASGTSMQDFVSTALLAAAQPALEPVSEPDVAQAVGYHVPARSRRVSKRMTVLLAASLLFVSGLAAAQTGLVTRVIELARVTIFVSASKPRPEHGARAVRQLESAQKRRHSSSHAPTRAVPQAALELALPAALPVQPVPAAQQPLALAEPVVQEPALSASQITESHRKPAATSRERSRRHRASARAQRAPEVEAPAPVASGPVSAASLFERASEARREGRWLEASGLYRELSARYAGSAEARLSLVLVARMQLDRGEPRAALAGFSAYLASGDSALREEALAGRALAQKRLGQSEAERDSVRALVREYPDSPYGRRALERLEQGAP